MPSLPATSAPNGSDWNAFSTLRRQPHHAGDVPPTILRAVNTSTCRRRCIQPRRAPQNRQSFTEYKLLDCMPPHASTSSPPAKDMTDQTLNTQITISAAVQRLARVCFRPSYHSACHYRSGSNGEAKAECRHRQQLRSRMARNYMLHRNNPQLKAMVGYSWQLLRSMAQRREQDFPPTPSHGQPRTGYLQQMPEGRLGMGSYKNTSKLISVLRRLSYNWNNRYMATASLRLRRLVALR